MNISTDRLEKGLYWQRAWKLVEGCTKVSAGCDNCWSEEQDTRWTSHPNENIRLRAKDVVMKTGVKGSLGDGTACGYQEIVGYHGEIICRQDNLDLPLRMHKPTVFALWNDLWHEDVPLSFICDVLQVMERARSLGHTFLVLTKRADRMGGFLGDIGEPVPDHIWHGITAENQEQADLRLPHLLQVPGKRFVSVEPMLGPIDFGLSCGCTSGCSHEYCTPFEIDAVLLGGESGKHARPMHPGWVRSVRDQCAAAEVPFFFKQWGEWGPYADRGCGNLLPSGNLGQQTRAIRDLKGQAIVRVGKKKAGRTLDDQTHDALPWANPVGSPVTEPLEPEITG